MFGCTSLGVAACTGTLALRRLSHADRRNDRLSAAAAAATAAAADHERGRAPRLGGPVLSSRCGLGVGQEEFETLKLVRVQRCWRHECDARAGGR